MDKTYKNICILVRYTMDVNRNTKTLSKWNIVHSHEDEKVRTYYKVEDLYFITQISM